MIKIYADAVQFLTEVQSLLLEREAVSQLLFANAVGAGERPCAPDCMFGTVTLAEEPVLAFCNCLPWNLIIHAVSAPGTKTDGLESGVSEEEEKLKRAAGELADHMKENGVPLNGINANHIVCEGFLARYDADRRIARKNLSMDIMECRTLKDIVLQPGIYRCAAESDVEWILEGCIAFEKEALGKEGDREKLRENIINEQLRKKQVRLFCLPDCTPVAMAKRTRNLQNGFAFSQVYTLPAFRGRGYAQTLIFKMCEEFFKEGFSFGTLFVDKTNPVSNRVYEKVGFEIVEDNYDYRFMREQDI